MQSAKVVAPPEAAADVQFGSTVTLVRDDGRRATYRIVGEDEANPAKGTLSYASPLAQALMGKRAGDAVEAGAGQAEILSVS